MNTSRQPSPKALLRLFDEVAQETARDPRPLRCARCGLPAFWLELRAKGRYECDQCQPLPDGYYVAIEALPSPAACRAAAEDIARTGWGHAKAMIMLARHARNRR